MSELRISGSESELAQAPSRILTENCQALQIDLSSITFLKSLELTQFRCLIDLALKGNISVTVIPPKNSSVLNYAGRVGLFEGTNYKYSFQQQAPDKFTTLIRIDSDRNDFLADECQRIFRYSNVSANYTWPLAESFVELADNIYYHAGIQENSGWGYVHAQVYERGIWKFKKGYLCLSVVDMGVGIHGSYVRTGQTKSRNEIQILQDAFKEGESSLNVPPGPPTRGIGLHEVFQFIKGFSGKITIRTGKAQVVGTSSGLEASSLHYPVHGTWIALEVPIL